MSGVITPIIKEKPSGRSSGKSPPFVPHLNMSPANSYDNAGKVDEIIRWRKRIQYICFNQTEETFNKLAIERLGEKDAPSRFSHSSVVQ